MSEKEKCITAHTTHTSLVRINESKFLPRNWPHHSHSKCWLISENQSNRSCIIIINKCIKVISQRRWRYKIGKTNWLDGEPDQPRHSPRNEWCDEYLTRTIILWLSVKFINERNVKCLKVKSLSQEKHWWADSDDQTDEPKGWFLYNRTVRHLVSA